jgi:hypothetical protein
VFADLGGSLHEQDVYASEPGDQHSSSVSPLTPVRSGLFDEKLDPRLDGRRVNAVLFFLAGSPLWMFGLLLGTVEWPRQPQKAARAACSALVLSAAWRSRQSHIFVLGTQGRSPFK